MSFKSAWSVSSQNTTPLYPLSPQEMQYDPLNPPTQLPYSLPPPSYYNTFPNATFQDPFSNSPPPPYYPPTGPLGTYSTQPFSTTTYPLPQPQQSGIDAPSTHPFRQTPPQPPQQQPYPQPQQSVVDAPLSHPFRQAPPLPPPPQSYTQPQQYQHSNPSQHDQWVNPTPVPFSTNSGTTSPDYSPSCPPLENDITQSPPTDRAQRGILSKASSIGFEDINGNQPPAALYPLLFDDICNNSSNENSSQTPTPLPPNLVKLWHSSKPVNVFFVQEGGHVVNPHRSLGFCAYKSPPMVDVSSFPAGSLAGNLRNATVILKAEEAWRLGLAKQRSFIVKGLHGEFAFYDDSTSPVRVVILILPKEIKSDERQRLEVLLQASSAMIDEPSNIVDKLESGVETVFDSLTESVNSVVKKGTPELHKTTKWLRKGTGQVVRFGGSLVSKGIHLVSDNVMDKETPKVIANQHTKVIEALKNYREAVEKNIITKVRIRS